MTLMLQAILSGYLIGLVGTLSATGLLMLARTAARPLARRLCVHAAAGTCGLSWLAAGALVVGLYIGAAA